MPKAVVISELEVRLPPVDITGAYATRVRAGKELEFEVIRQLVEMGHYVEIRVGEDGEIDDMKEGIDCWLLMDDGKLHAVQIKVRQTGDDIIYELYYDKDTKSDGRDVKGRSEFYLVVDTQGVGTMIRTDLIRDMEPMLRAAYDEGNMRSRKWMLFEKTEEGDINDAGVERVKLLAYIKPPLHEIIQQWQFVR